MAQLKTQPLGIDHENWNSRREHRYFAGVLPYSGTKPCCNFGGTTRQLLDVSVVEQDRALQRYRLCFADRIDGVIAVTATQEIPD